MTENEDAIATLLGFYAESLSSWEENFLESLTNQELLSPKQQEILDRIWDEVVDQGRYRPC